jgi:hypothetical protein
LIKYGELKLRKKIYDLTKEIQYWRNEAYSARTNPWRTLCKELNRLILDFLGKKTRLDYLYVVLADENISRSTTSRDWSRSEHQYAIVTTSVEALAPGETRNMYDIYELHYSYDYRSPRNPKNLVASNVNQERVMRLLQVQMQFGWFSEVYDRTKKRISYKDLHTQHNRSWFCDQLQVLGSRRFILPQSELPKPVHSIFMRKQQANKLQKRQMFLDLLQTKLKVE